MNKILKVDLLICFALVLILYLPTLDRSWIFYDERLIFDELAVPIPSSFKEIFEIINSFGVVNNLSSTNFLYSSNSVNRPSLLGVPFLLLVGLFFKKSAFLYHAFNLFLHLINTGFVYLILRQAFSFSNFNFLNRFLIVILTSIWAIHPVNSESILLSTNIGANLSYLIFFALFYDFIKNRHKNHLFYRQLLLPVSFLIPMLLNEYIIALPLVILTYSLIQNLTTNLKNSIKTSLKESSPYLIGFFIYLIYFYFSSYKFYKPSEFNHLTVAIERILWLSPQIFIHSLKLVFFPKILSIDQTGLVQLGKSLFDTYSIFCTLFLLLWLGIPLILFIKNKTSYPFLLVSWLFFISFLPFSQIPTATYCLIAERYFYTPLFFIIFGIANILSRRGIACYTPTLFILFCLLCTLSIRTYNRTLDWKDNYSLLNSTIKSSTSLLYKGSRIDALGEVILRSNPEKIVEAKKYFLKAQGYFHKALKELKTEKNKYKDEPVILKSYGLDYDSLLVKATYFICIEVFNNPSSSNEEYSKKLKIFTPYLKYIDSFDPRTLELYANLLIKNNEPERAKKVFLYAYKKYPTSPFILISLIRFEREIEKNLNETKKYLDKALELYPYSKDILFETLRYDQLANNLPDYARHSYLYGLRTHSGFFYREALTGFLMLGQKSEANKISEKLKGIN